MGANHFRFAKSVLDVTRLRARGTVETNT